MSRLTIIEGNTNDKDNVRTFFGKAEKGDDGVSPEASVTKSNGIATITIKDANGTTNASIEDGFDPVVETSKTGGVATISITDAEGTHSFNVNDGETYEVPTNSVIGWESDDAIPNGYEEVDNPNKYSTDEQIIGTWIDGKPLYRKVVSFGALPNADTKRVEHGISNLKNVINVSGISKRYIPSTQTYNWQPLPLLYAGNSTSFNTSLSINPTVISIACDNDRTDFTENYIIIEYTKTTD